MLPCAGRLLPLRLTSQGQILTFSLRNGKGKLQGRGLGTLPAVCSAPSQLPGKSSIRSSSVGLRRNHPPCRNVQSLKMPL